MVQEKLFGFFTENALEMIISFNNSGVIAYANSATDRYLEYEGELKGSDIYRIFPKLKEYNLDEAGGYKQMSELTELMAYRKNLTCFPVCVRFFKYDENTNICMCCDMTENVYLEKQNMQIKQEVEEAQKVKNEFVANVTHELRTPVNGILGNTLELLSVETEGDKKQKLKMIERGCNDMNAIINNILDFSKLEAGKFSLEKREFNFRKMVDYVKSNHTNKITEKGLEFFVTISPEVPEYIIGDELRIVQVLNNLLSNATKFTSVGKIIVEIIKTAQLNNRIELFFIVIDTGIGLNKLEQDKLFKSFSQVDASISRKYGGTGLGLNICKQLVELMEGTVRVESEKDRGSMFSFSIWVDLPVSAQSENSGIVDADAAILKLKNMREEASYNSVKEFGEDKNIDEIKNKMSKLILCVDMDNWDKAEVFVNIIKQLTENAPKEIKTAALKLKMAVQKANVEKIYEAYNLFEGLLKDFIDAGI